MWTNTITYNLIRIIIGPTQRYIRIVKYMRVLDPFHTHGKQQVGTFRPFAERPIYLVNFFSRNWYFKRPRRNNSFYYTLVSITTVQIKYITNSRYYYLPITLVKNPLFVSCSLQPSPSAQVANALHILGKYTTQSQHLTEITFRDNDNMALGLSYCNHIALKSFQKDR